MSTPATTKVVGPCSGLRVKKDEDEEKHRMDTFLRQEMRILHRNYLKLESGGTVENRLTSFRCHNNVRLLRHLKEERKELHLYLRKCEKSQQVQKEDPNAMSIDDLILTYEKQVGRVTESIAQAKDITANVDTILSMIQKTQLRTQKMYGEAPALDQMTRKIDHLESKLAFELGRFNKTRVDSSKIRQLIHWCLAERGLFYKRMKNYYHTIRMLKNQMVSVAHKINDSFDKYDEAKNQEKHLITRNELDCQSFLAELRENARLLSYTRDVRKFVDIKNRKRPTLELGRNREYRHRMELLHNTKRILPSYQKAFKLIADVSGSHNVEWTRQNYIDTLQKNFALYRYVTHAEDCVEGLSQEIGDLRLKLSTLQNFHEDQRNFCLSTLKEEKEKNIRLTQEMHLWREQFEQQSEEMTQILSEFKEIYEMTGADQIAMAKLLGNDPIGITPKNLLLHFAILERQILFRIWQKEMMVSGMRGTVNIKTLTGALARMVHLDRKTQVIYGGPYQPVLKIPTELDKDNEDDDKLFSRKRFSYEELREICRALAEKSIGLLKAFTVGSSDSIDELGRSMSEFGEHWNT